MLNPFDVKAALTARHAQHVVLVHFPIALCAVGVVFDLLARWTRREAFGVAAFYNLMAAAFATVPTVVTGLVAWQWQFEGQRLKGNLLLHLVFGIVGSLLIWLVCGLRLRARRRLAPFVNAAVLAVELATVIVIGATAHIGGILSGVNLLH